MPELSPHMQQILQGSNIPPQLRAMLPTNPQARTPEESLNVLIAVITGLANRGANGLTLTTTPDPHGVTIRIDLPH